MHPPPIAIVILLPTDSIIRVVIEQQTYVETIQSASGTDCLDRISGLEALLESAPALPERKLSWHRALEKLLDGTREGEIAICAVELKD